MKHVTVTAVAIPVNQNQKQAVSMRDVHAFLEVDSHFKDWSKRQIERCMLVENQDYILVAQKRATNNSKNPTTNQTDYALTLSAAKELAMMNGGERGKSARLYFIECERQQQALAEVAAAAEMKKIDITQEFPVIEPISVMDDLLGIRCAIITVGGKTEMWYSLTSILAKLNTNITAKSDRIARQLPFGQALKVNDHGKHTWFVPRHVAVNY